MSLLKANSVQIGQSSTATNNFTLSVPTSPDGTIKLARGNSGATTADVLSVNASGAIEGKKVRHLFTAELTNRGVNEGKHIATCTNAIYRPLLGGTAGLEAGLAGGVGCTFVHAFTSLSSNRRISTVQPTI